MEAGKQGRRGVGIEKAPLQKQLHSWEQLRESVSARMEDRQLSVICLRYVYYVCSWRLLESEKSCHVISWLSCHFSRKRGSSWRRMGPKLSPFAFHFPFPQPPAGICCKEQLRLVPAGECRWKREWIAVEDWDAINNHNLSQVLQCLAAGFHAVLKAQAS
jgi:hypothetical protein